MPTRKQKRREAKAKRHEYEFVYVDDEGNEVDEVPEELAAAKPERRDGAKPAAKKSTPQRGAAGRRTPQPPSWQRAARRALILGAVVFVLFTFTAKKGHNAYASALVPAVIYTALFIPFTYLIDRFAYSRWQARNEQGGSTPKKR
ncbi:MAG TPA: hypothetical protein VE261_02655 [Gaiellaceae bacterium]|nr:hypothetical protein [Gaiellaceae bacterium]